MSRRIPRRGGGSGGGPVTPVDLQEAYDNGQSINTDTFGPILIGTGPTLTELDANILSVNTGSFVLRTADTGNDLELSTAEGARLVLQPTGIDLVAGNVGPGYLSLEAGTDTGNYITATEAGVVFLWSVAAGAASEAGGVNIRCSATNEAFGISNGLVVDASGEPAGAIGGTGKLKYDNTVISSATDPVIAGALTGSTPGSPDSSIHLLAVTSGIAGTGAKPVYVGGMGYALAGSIADVVICSIEQDDEGDATPGGIEIVTGMDSDRVSPGSDQIALNCGGELGIVSRADSIISTASINFDVEAGNNLRLAPGDNDGINYTGFCGSSVSTLLRTIDSLGDSLSQWRNGKADPMIGGPDPLLWSLTSATMTPAVIRGGGCTMSVTAGQTGLLEGSPNQAWMAREGRSRMRQYVALDSGAADQKLRIGIRLNGSLNDRAYFEYDASADEWSAIVVTGAGATTDCTLAPIAGAPGDFVRLDLIETPSVSGGSPGALFTIDGVTLGIGNGDDCANPGTLRGPFIECETTADGAANTIGRTEVWVSANPAGQ